MYRILFKELGNLYVSITSSDNNRRSCLWRRNWWFWMFNNSTRMSKNVLESILANDSHSLLVHACELYRLHWISLDWNIQILILSFPPIVFAFIAANFNAQFQMIKNRVENSLQATPIDNNSTRGSVTSKTSSYTSSAYHGSTQYYKDLSLYQKVKTKQVLVCMLVSVVEYTFSVKI